MHYYNIFLLKLIGENIELVDLYNCEEEGDCQIELQPPRNDSMTQEAPKFNGSAKGFKL